MAMTTAEINALLAKISAGTYTLQTAEDAIASAAKGADVREALYALPMLLANNGVAGCVDTQARSQIANLLSAGLSGDDVSEKKSSVSVTASTQQLLSVDSLDSTKKYFITASIFNNTANEAYIYLTTDNDVAGTIGAGRNCAAGIVTGATTVYLRGFGTAGTYTADVRYIELGNSEVTDARTADDGTVYDSLGDAMREQFSTVKENLADFNCMNLFSNYTKTNETTKGITFAWSGETCTVSGTSTAEAFSNLYANTKALPSGMEAGETYRFIYEPTDKNIGISIFGYDASGTALFVKRFFETTDFTIPSDCAGMIIRFNVYSGLTVNGTTTAPKFLNSCTNKELSTLINAVVSHEYLESCDLNDVSGNAIWLLLDVNTYEHGPADIANVGSLIAYKNGEWVFQIFIPLSTAGIYKRRYNGSKWSDWSEAASSGNTYNNTYEQNHYENSYSITCTPSITADSNNYLSATGTTDDVTASIQAMLNSAKVCHLGPGDFYVTGITMPNDSMLIGSGPSTRVILSGSNSDEGYAVKLMNRCSVKDMTIMGNTADLTVSSTIVERHGILFESTYNADSSFIQRCNIENVWIRNFSGGGITCYNTGYNCIASINVCNAWIYSCNAGINIPYWSEFHRFTNCHCGSCYYGAINNGGNCSFINCCFTGNKLGMLMDNSTGAATNNSHGTVVGCIFDHADSNNGVGIKIDGMVNGEIFSDCQLFYADIEVNNSIGIQFNNFNIGGSGDAITVAKGSAGGLVIFNDCVFQDGSYTINVDSDYTACKFVNCWTRNGVAVTG